jgi:hypothetical protein
MVSRTVSSQWEVSDYAEDRQTDGANSGSSVPQSYNAATKRKIPSLGRDQIAIM